MMTELLVCDATRTPAVARGKQRTKSGNPDPGEVLQDFSDELVASSVELCEKTGWRSRVVIFSGLVTHTRNYLRWRRLGAYGGRMKACAFHRRTPPRGPQRDARCPGVGKSTRTVHRSWIRRDSGAMESAKAIGRSVSSRVLGLDGKTSIFDHGKVRGAATTRPDPRAVPMWRGD